MTSSFFQIKKTIGNFLLLRSKKSSNHSALSQLVGDKVEFTTFGDYTKMVESVAVGLNELGIKRKDQVGLFLNTCIQWNVFDLGVMSSGLITVPIHHFYDVEDIANIASHTNIKVLFLKTERDLQKILPIIHLFKDLRAVISLEKISSKALDSMPSGVDYKYYNKFIKDVEGVKKKKPDLFQQLINNTSENDPATILYSSGTTGKPKGSVLTHASIIQMLLNVKSHSQENFSKRDTTLIFLPLSHILGRCNSLLSLIFGWKSVYTEWDQALMEKMKLVNPSIIIGVPAVFEKIYTQVYKSLEEGLGIKRKSFLYFLNCASEYYETIELSRTPSVLQTVKYKLAYKLVFSKIVSHFGPNLRYFICGGDLIATQVAKLFKYSKVTLLEGYGLTETFGPVTINPLSHQKVGTVGRPIGDVEISFTQEGEIKLRSKVLFKTYFNADLQNLELNSPDSFFSTGDIGEFDEDGFLKILGRKSDTITLLSGDIVNPGFIEAQLRLSPYIYQSLIVGDQREFLTALIALDEAPLTHKKKPLSDREFRVLAQKKSVTNKIRNHIQDVNKTLPLRHKIGNFKILPVRPSIKDYLTPTLKMKRRPITHDFGELIDTMYH